MGPPRRRRGWTSVRVVRRRMGQAHPLVFVFPLFFLCSRDEKAPFLFFCFGGTWGGEHGCPTLTARAGPGQEKAK